MKSFVLSCFVFSTLASTAPADQPLVQATLQTIDPDIKPDHYDTAGADLDGDGKEDVLALMNGKSGYCGSGGCTMFVLKAREGGFTSMGTMKVVNPPIYLRKSATKGMRDLLVTVRGGGATPGLAALAFDGSAYPAAPGDATAKLEKEDAVLFAESSTPFEKSDSLHGITFKVTSPNSKPANTIQIIPAGLENDNSPISETTNSIVTGAEVADINADGSPEVYVYTKDDKNRAGLVAYSANKKKSLSQIYLPELGEDGKGYRGGDEFAVVEGVIGRRFPIYPEDGSKTDPTGKIRQIQYRLQAGEAGWLLKVEEVIEF